VAWAVADSRAQRGILVCGSGAGVSVAATKVRGIRAATVSDTYTAHQSVEHDDLNVLCLGARVIGPELARELVRAFVDARFSGAERHKHQLAEVREIERHGIGAPAEGKA
jgi:ribose 5-phosphate isomerase B